MIGQQQSNFVVSDGSCRMTVYDINHIYPTLQGEGAQTGIPMVLLRLQGCGVGCPFCDTKETWHTLPTNQRFTWEEALGVNSLFIRKGCSEIVTYIAKLYPYLEWVLVTGGEPANFELRGLVNALHDGGYKVALETSGTALGHLNAPFDWITVSPKINQPGGKVVQPIALANADEIKFVVGKKSDIETLEDHLNQWTLKPNCQICLQPMSQIQRATELCIQTCLARGWRLSLQTHKYLTLP